MGVYLPAPSEFPPLFSQYYTLPTAKYYTPQLARLNDGEVMIGSMDDTLITNATSLYPVVGTESVDSCVGLGLYNPLHHRTVVTHQPNMIPLQFQDYLEQARSADTEPLAIHIIGLNITRSPHVPADLNMYSINQMEDLLQEIVATPNVTIKTFDVYDKAKPLSMAIDSRNGRLIRGTELLRSAENEPLCDSLFEVFDRCDTMNFDGTQAEFQKAAHHKR